VDAASADWGSLQETLKANPYVYANNDAVNEVDPSGTTPTVLGEVLACITGAAADLLGLLKPILVAGLAAIIAGEAAPEITWPAAALVAATVIIGCLIGTVLYTLAANLPGV
jgi:hypothetical protein